MNRSDYESAYKAVRPAVLERDGHACVKCGSVVSLETHHVNGYEDTRPENIRTLCYYCHGVAPMGAAYWEWERNGIDGWTACLTHMLRKFPTVDVYWLRCQLEGLADYMRFMRVSGTLATRLQKRLQTGRCEGRKPYGARDGESVILDLIRSMRAQPAAEISDGLNRRGYKTRYGLDWRPETIRKILARLD